MFCCFMFCRYRGEFFNLVESGKADVNSRYLKSARSTRFYNTPLGEAAKFGQLGMVKYLLKTAPSVLYFKK